MLTRQFKPQKRAKRSTYRLLIPDEKLIISLIDKRKIVHLGDVDGHFVHILKAATRGLEYFSQVAEGLPLKEVEYISLLFFAGYI